MNKYLLAHILLICFSSAAFANTARVLSLVPGVESSLAGKTTALAMKMDVPIKSIIKSDLTGKAQFMFPDGATISVAPDTEIALSEFVEKTDEENIVINLAKGTARIITGDVSRRNPSAFVVKTPQAIIGVRGTIVSIAVKGEETKIYLTETSGKGVYVQDKSTGNTLNLRTPGNIITVSPQGLEQRKPVKGEVAAINAGVKTVSAAAQTVQTAQTSQGAILSPVQALAAAGSSIGNKPVAEREQKLVADAGAGRIIQTQIKDIPKDVPSTPQVPGIDTPANPDLPITSPDIPASPDQDYKPDLTYKGNLDFKSVGNGAMYGTHFSSLDITFTNITIDKYIYHTYICPTVSPYPELSDPKSFIKLLDANTAQFSIEINGNYSVLNTPDDFKPSYFIASRDFNLNSDFYLDKDNKFSIEGKSKWGEIIREDEPLIDISKLNPPFYKVTGEFVDQNTVSIKYSVPTVLDHPTNDSMAGSVTFEINKK